MSAGFPQPCPLPGAEAALRDPLSWHHPQGIHGWQEGSPNDGKGRGEEVVCCHMIGIT